MNKTKRKEPTNGWNQRIATVATSRTVTFLPLGRRLLLQILQIFYLIKKVSVFCNFFISANFCRFLLFLRPKRGRWCIGDVHRRRRRRRWRQRRRRRRYRSRILSPATEMSFFLTFSRWRQKHLVFLKLFIYKKTSGFNLIWNKTWNESIKV